MNNRQSGRRRGRNNNNGNNNRSQSGGRGGVDQANRIDSRARGNAAQMIEKYRNLARDAQLAGDRVQTEYYLQFADHYFRVLSDFRARQDEKNAQSGQDRGHDRHREIRGVEDFDGHDDSDFDVESDRSDSEGEARPQQDRERRDDDDNRGNRRDRDRGGRRNRDTGRDASRDEAVEGEPATADAPAPVEAGSDAAAPAARGARRGPRRTRPVETDDDSAGIDSAALPPAIGRTDRAVEDAETEAPAPKARRTRRTLAARDTGVEAAE